MTKTIPGVFKQVVERYKNADVIYYRKDSQPFTAITHGEFYHLIKNFGCGLLSTGIRRKDHIGIISDNMKEWIIADMGILAIGAVDVPRGSDSTVNEILYILKHADCLATLVENQKQLEKILSIKKNLPQLKTIIVMDRDFKKTPALTKKAKVDLYTFDEVLELGKKKTEKNPHLFQEELSKGRGDDLATIIYTSGTTGEPKGVMLTHNNFLFQTSRATEILHIKPYDILLSVLPVWHSFERAIEYIILLNNAGIAYSKPVGSIMLKDMEDIKPQWMASVPRIWEGVRNAVYRKIKAEGGIKAVLFHFFVAIGIAHSRLFFMLRGLLPQFRRRIRIVDIIISFIPLILLTPLKLLGNLLVFKKLKQKLGGRFVAGISGGGALPPYVDRFFAAVGILLLEGYGLTESAPVISVRVQKKPVTGTIGPPLRDTDFKVLDENGQPLGPGKKGVLHVHGGQVMKGYYKKPEKTKEVLSEDGWLNTGDLAMYTHRNHLKIIGREKDTIVLRGGENIEPEPIEETILQSEYIDQVIVLGQDKKYLAALVVANPENLEQYARENNIKYLDINDLYENDEIKKFIYNELNSLINPQNGFKVWERIFRFTMLEKHFEVGKELTYTLKMKRDVINDLYKKEIEKLFK